MSAKAATRFQRIYRALLIPTLVLCFAATIVFAAGCAALDEAAVARTDRLPSGSFYKRYREPAGAPEPALLLPLRAQPGAASRLEPLRAAIDAHLRTQACCRGADDELPAGSPWLYVGSAEGETAPAGAEDMREAFDKYPPMVVHYARPAGAWRQAASALALRDGATRIVVTQLDFVQYPKADKGFLGKKVALGTRHEQDVRFLSAIDKPIEVLQISGAVLDADGNELCAGAEGIVGRDAAFWVQVLEAGRDIDDDTLQRVLHGERREDIPGAPLAWQAAADQLLWNLLRRCA